MRTDFVRLHKQRLVEVRSDSIAVEPLTKVHGAVLVP